MGKLVRDNIPDIIRASGRTPADRFKVRDEAADVLEVVISLTAYHGFSLNDVAREANRRRNERGGFTKRLWLD